MVSPSPAFNVHNRKIAIALALAGALPTPLPLSWLHKFYLGQYLWGVVYLVLAPTLIPQMACCFEGLWYFVQSDAMFTERFPDARLLRFPNSGSIYKGEDVRANLDVSKIAVQTVTAIREIEQLRQDGLITENEFEQKRRKLLEKV